MDQVEEQERLRSIDKILDRYPVRTKYQDLQEWNVKRIANRVSAGIAVNTLTMLLVSVLNS